MKASITKPPHFNPTTPNPIFDASSTLIRMPEVERIVGMKRSTIYKLMQHTDSGFPLPVKLSNSNARGAPVAWVLSEIQTWARSRIEARNQVAA
ncbi:AlpA family phage regulatory protein [Pseudomonas sp. ICBG1301]|uniref:helix-turn-helix transcriptional regulator n=1 Tax=Pseudomonas sp. ICBG1301 TaxID=2795987 RepID=UPI0019660468|nr:AlpA family phage regulatory protein [Pseudomonas sp. ICBG1301]MBM9485777.1 AlpA family phage regulatory protein [Pseudomonas sp. ICBG1301]